MGGMKSGTGDDLWSDEPPATDERSERTETTATTAPASTGETAADQQRQARDRASTDAADQPYIVRRAIQNEGVQWERDNRLTFFVHDDVADGERELVADVERELGRDVPKFDVREAVYRVALENRTAVLEELVEMGYQRE